MLTRCQALPGSFLVPWLSRPGLLAAAFSPSTLSGLWPSLSPALQGSNTGIIQFYEKPPGLPLEGPTTTGTRCAVLRVGLGGIRGGGRWAQAGGWEVGNPGNSESWLGGGGQGGREKG